MERIFTKDLGRYKVGDIRDYPIPTWQQMARSAGTDMDKFSRLKDDAARDGVTEKRPIVRRCCRRIK